VKFECLSALNKTSGFNFNDREIALTFEGVDNKVDLSIDHQFLQLFGPQILGRKIAQGNFRVEIARSLLGEDFELIVRMCFLEGSGNQLCLFQGELRLARADGEGSLGGGGGGRPS
jgi:hypothetical protein